MMVLSMPWHLVGLLGMPRRMAYYDYSHPDIHSQAWTVIASTASAGYCWCCPAFLLVWILARAHRCTKQRRPFTFSRAAHAGGTTPVALNGFGLWVAMMIGLTVVNYGYPIAQLAMLKEASVPVVPIGSR